MSDDDPMSVAPRGATRLEKIRSIGRGIPGLVPVIGPLLQTVIEDLIPDRRVERLEDFVSKLAERLSEVEMRSAVETDSGLSLLEVGLVDASRAATERRRGYIAEVLARGLRNPVTEASSAEHFLRLLSVVGDPDIVVLQGFHPFNRDDDGGMNEGFRRRNRDVVGPFDEAGEPDRFALNHSRKIFLVSAGLLRVSSEDWGTIGGARPQYAEREFQITPTGEAFLEYLGFPWR